MYASVIPAVKMPRGFREFDYEIPDEFFGAFGRGDLVAVPWRSKSVVGLVTATHETPSRAGLRLKPVLKRLTASPLPEDFTLMMEWLPTETFNSAALCLRASLPSFTKKITGGGLPEPIKPVPFERKPPRLRSVRYRSAEEKLSLISETAGRCAREGRQCLVLMPHQSDVRAAVESLAAAGIPGVTEVLGATTTKKYRGAWLAALSGEAAVVVGTRSASTFPFLSLGAIVVAESDSRDHRQYDQNPRFDARTVAVWRSRQTGAELLLMSHAPRPEDLLAAALDPVSADEAAEAVLVSVTRQEKTAAPLSPSSLRHIEDALQRGEKVLIFHNRLGAALAIFCRDCGEPLRCPKCQIAMRSHGSGLRCHRCRAERPAPCSCPKCGGIGLRPYGAGSSGLAAALAGEFPKAVIVRLDSESGSGAELASADIIIGTQLAVHELSELPGLADGLTTVIATDTDELLSHPGFRTSEQAWRTVTTLRDLAGQGRLLLETLDPDNKRLRRLLDAPEKFLAEELEIRAETGYPPAGELVTVTVADPSEETGRERLEKLRASLEPLTGAKARISRPIQPNQPYRHGKWRWLLAIRHAESSPGLTLALEHLSENFLVERDPDSIT